MSVLTFYLTVVINKSIVTGLVPTEWKHTIVCPLYKQGDNKNPRNFRPVALLPVLSKILEKNVATQNI